MLETVRVWHMRKNLKYDDSSSLAELGFVYRPRARLSEKEQLAAYYCSSKSDRRGSVLLLFLWRPALIYLSFQLTKLTMLVFFKIYEKLFSIIEYSYTHFIYCYFLVYW